ncbi:hypothetical protein LTR74_009813 [Friedmanniomyces endolithicus]|nr:hypothetical protein LTR74_009813 [Friedmanniomyces endolithicus]
MSAIKKVVLTDKAPPPIKGVYNQAIVANGTVYCSGQIGTDPATGKIVEGDVQAHTVINRVAISGCKTCEADTLSTKSSRISPPSSRRQGPLSTMWSRSTSVRLSSVALGQNIGRLTLWAVIADIKDFKAMNEVYMQYWGETKPARSCVQAQPPMAGLPVEIECIAVMP